MNILVTAIGSMSALCVINRLHAAGHRVIGCDIYPKEWHYEAALCDAFRQAPYATKPQEYIPFLVELCQTYDVDHIFPLTDVEIDTLNAHRPIFQDMGVVLCMPSEQTLAIVRDKKQLHDVFCDDDLVPSVPTYTSEDAHKLSFPCIAKPRNGRSSEGLHILQSEEQIRMLPNIDNYILQERIVGSICTVDIVRLPGTQEVYAIPREELLRTKNGAGTTVRLFHDDNLQRLVRHIAQRLDIVGVVNMEFIQTDGNYYLIDINPRFSAGIAFSCHAGYDFILAHLAAFDDQQLPHMGDYTDGIQVKYFIEK